MARAKSISIITLGVQDLQKSIAFYEELGWECSPEYCGFTLAITGASAKEVDELFAMAERAGGTVWQKPQWKNWGGCDGYSGYFLDPDGYPWEVAYAPFLRLSENNRLLPKTKAEMK